MLRNDFIHATNCPRGVKIVSASLPIDMAIHETRAALLQPEYAGVVIHRDYPDLSAIANRLFALHRPGQSVFDFDQADSSPAFANDAGQDFLNVLDCLRRDQDFEDLECGAPQINRHIPHIDDIFPASHPRNLDHGCMPGGTAVIQAVSKSGVGIYCTDELVKAGTAPVYRDPIGWHIDNDHPGFAGLAPYFVRPGDIAVIRQGDWPENFAPSVHTSPVCNRSRTDRVAYLAFGYARAVAP